jgi:hypothetical protein
MLTIHNGQCGLCAHFGEGSRPSDKLVQIRTKRSAPDDYIELCGHPKHAPLNLKVSAISGCAGFEPVR